MREGEGGGDEQKLYSSSILYMHLCSNFFPSRGSVRSCFTLHAPQYVYNLSTKLHFLLLCCKRNINANDRWMYKRYVVCSAQNCTDDTGSNVHTWLHFCLIVLQHRYKNGTCLRWVVGKLVSFLQNRNNNPKNNSSLTTVTHTTIRTQRVFKLHLRVSHKPA